MVRFRLLEVNKWGMIKVKICRKYMLRVLIG